MTQLRNWHKAHKDSLTIGERAADRMRNGMGSWAYVNTSDAFRHWDNYPFILLNLFLSMLAALQGAILLIAAKRADAISAAMAKSDYETNIQAEKGVEELKAIHRKQIELLEALLKKLDEK